MEKNKEQLSSEQFQENFRAWRIARGIDFSLIPIGYLKPDRGYFTGSIIFKDWLKSQSEVFKKVKLGVRWHKPPFEDYLVNGAFQEIRTRFSVQVICWMNPTTWDLIYEVDFDGWGKSDLAGLVGHFLNVVWHKIPHLDGNKRVTDQWAVMQHLRNQGIEVRDILSRTSLPA